jgi:hypothetical protein
MFAVCLLLQDREIDHKCCRVASTPACHTKLEPALTLRGSDGGLDHVHAARAMHGNSAALGLEPVLQLHFECEWCRQTTTPAVWKQRQATDEPDEHSECDDKIRLLPTSARS